MPDSMSLRMVNNTSAYKLSGQSGSTNADKRKAVVALLKDRMVAVNGVVVNKNRLDKLVGSGGVTVKLPFIHEGTVLVNGNGDVSEGSYPIIAHHVVCFDMELSNGVTGVNPEWKSDEFYPVGIALANLASGQKLVPVMLQNSNTLKQKDDENDDDDGGGGGGDSCCLMPFELTDCLNAGKCAAAVKLEMNTDGELEAGDQVIIVCDRLLKDVIGCPGDRGTYQNIDGTNVIISLQHLNECECPEDATPCVDNTLNQDWHPDLIVTIPPLINGQGLIHCNRCAEYAGNYRLTWNPVFEHYNFTHNFANIICFAPGGATPTGLIVRLGMTCSESDMITATISLSFMMNSNMPAWGLSIPEISQQDFLDTLRGPGYVLHTTAPGGAICSAGFPAATATVRLA